MDFLIRVWSTRDYGVRNRSEISRNIISHTIGKKPVISDNH